MNRGIGVAALVGLGASVVGLGVAGIGELGSGDPVVGYAIVVGGLALVAACWPVWGSCSGILERAEADVLGRMRTRDLAQMGLIASLGFGVLLVLIGAVPFLVLADGPDRVGIVLAVLSIGGLVPIAGAIVGAAIAGAVTLAGASWWWVGVVFSAGFAAVVAGMAGGPGWLVTPGVVLLVVSIWGYGRARSAGERKAAAAKETAGPA